MKDQMFEDLLASAEEMVNIEKDHSFERLREGMSKKAQAAAKEKAEAMLKEMAEKDSQS